MDYTSQVTHTSQTRRLSFHTRTHARVHSTRNRERSQASFFGCQTLSVNRTCRYIGKRAVSRALICFLSPCSSSSDPATLMSASSPSSTGSSCEHSQDNNAWTRKTNQNSSDTPRYRASGNLATTDILPLLSRQQGTMADATLARRGGLVRFPSDSPCLLGKGLTASEET